MATTKHRHTREQLSKWQALAQQERSSELRIMCQKRVSPKKFWDRVKELTNGW